MHFTLYVQLGSIMYLALINRAGGLYGRILTRPRSPVVRSVPVTEVKILPITDRPSSVNKMFIIWPNKKAKEQKHK